MRLHLIARGGGATDTGYDGLCALYAQELELANVTTCQALCLATQNQACGVTGLINGKPFNGEFTFDEWVEYRLNPVTGRFAADQEQGIAMITALDKRQRCERFDGKSQI